jgi:hypothetical protein
MLSFEKLSYRSCRSCGLAGLAGLFLSIDMHDLHDLQDLHDFLSAMQELEFFHQSVIDQLVVLPRRI